MSSDLKVTLGFMRGPVGGGGRPGDGKRAIIEATLVQQSATWHQHFTPKNPHLTHLKRILALSAICPKSNRCKARN